MCRGFKENIVSLSQERDKALAIATSGSGDTDFASLYHDIAQQLDAEKDKFNGCHDLVKEKLTCMVSENDRLTAKIEEQ